MDSGATAVEVEPDGSSHRSSTYQETHFDYTLPHPAQAQRAALQQPAHEVTVGAAGDGAPQPPGRQGRALTVMLLVLKRRRQPKDPRPQPEGVNLLKHV